MIRLRGFLREFCRGVFAVVIDEYDRKLAGIILLRDRRDRLGDRFGFVARGDYCSYGGPSRRSGMRCFVIIEWTKIPEISAREEEVEPDGECN